MSKDPRVYLAHILECIEKIQRFTADGEGRFRRDAMVQDAVLRNFEVIGEAAKRLDNAYRLGHRGRGIARPEAGHRRPASAPGPARARACRRGGPTGGTVMRPRVRLRSPIVARPAHMRAWTARAAPT